MTDLRIMQTLEKNYGYNNPILLNELNFEGISEVNLRQILTRLAKQGNIERYSQGVYYIPKNTPLGKSRLSAKKVYEKKYIRNNQNVYGYYSGLTLENALGLTMQIPNVVEIVTNNEKTKLREVQVGSQKIRVRKSKVRITEQNVRVLQFLDLMNRYNKQKIVDEEREKIVDFIKNQNILKEDVYKYISQYPSKVSKIMIEGGFIDELM